MGQLASPLRLCVVVRSEAPRTEGSAPAKNSPAGAASGPLIVLYETLEARVLLGCVIDMAGQVQDWLEVWVQSVSAAASAPSSVRGILSNSVLDERWGQMFRGMEAADPAGVLHTGWEFDPPRPMWLDLAGMRPYHAVDRDSGESWLLCRDEGILAAAALPPYGSSLHRYLYLPRGDKKPFIPITPDAPAPPGTQPLSALLGGREDLVPLNIGGLMMIRQFDSVTLESFLDILSGRPGAVLSPFLPRVLASTDPKPSGTEQGWLFLGRHGRRARLLESFHIRLKALADAVESVRVVTALTQRPLLNLDADHFRVRAMQPGAAMPHFWGARVVLSQPGGSVSLSVPGTDIRYFSAVHPAGTPIYQPVRTSQPVMTRGGARVRQIIPAPGDTVVVEGTLSSQGHLDAAANDLLWIRLSDSNGPVDLYARVSTEPGLPPGEYRFRSLDQNHTPATVAFLKSVAGVPVPVTCQVLPMTSSASDLYSLAVLAVRMFLVNSESSLPVALDDMLSFARQVAQQHDSSLSLPVRISGALDSAPRWLKALGPHRLSWERLSPEQVRDLVPHDLWAALLGTIVTMFPGVGPDSICPDLSAAPAGAPQRVFDPLRKELDSLLVRSRSLIVIDWRYNRELTALIKGEMARLASPLPTVPPPPRPAVFSDVRPAPRFVPPSG